MPKPPTYERPDDSPTDDFKRKLEDSLKSRQKKQDKYPVNPVDPFEEFDASYEEDNLKQNKSKRTSGVGLSTIRDFVRSMFQVLMKYTFFKGKKSKNKNHARRNCEKHFVKPLISVLLKFKSRFRSKSSSNSLFMGSDSDGNSINSQATSSTNLELQPQAESASVARAVDAAVDSAIAEISKVPNQTNMTQAAIHSINGAIYKIFRAWKPEMANKELLEMAASLKSTQVDWVAEHLGISKTEASKVIVAAPESMTSVNDTSSPVTSSASTVDDSPVATTPKPVEDKELPPVGRVKALAQLYERGHHINAKEESSNANKTMSWAREGNQNADRGYPSRESSSSTDTQTSTPTSLQAEPPGSPKHTYGGVEDAISSVAGYSDSYMDKYIDKLDKEARELLGDRYSEANSILLNTQQIRGIGQYLAANQNAIEEWFADNPNEVILRIGKKVRQRDKQFQGGELDRTVEIHRSADGGFKVYVAISRKLATGHKKMELAREGTFKKVTRLVLLNPEELSDKTKLLGTVSKRQINPTKEMYDELNVERKVYGDDSGAVSVGREYSKRPEERVVRTSETSALGDLNMLIEPGSNDLYASDSSYDPSDPKGSVLRINERITDDILECMQKIHSKGYVHNDIKPDNILLVRDEKGRLRARVSDFGWAMKIGKGQPMATLHYASPQVFQTHLAKETEQSEYFKNKYPAIGRAVYRDMKGWGLRGLSRLPKGANPKDDMWAVGITLLHLHGVEFSVERKEKLQEVLQDKNAHPFILKHRELLSSLLSEHRKGRPTAENAQRQLAKSPTPPIQRRRY